MNAAQDILQKTEEYIDMSVKSPVIEQPTYEMEEFSTYSPQSNYSEMVETIATKSTDSFLYDEDE